MAAPRQPIDPWAVAAASWIAVAVALTVLIGPDLGLRGWAWMSLHHVLCALGAGHELWRAHKRSVAWQAAASTGDDGRT